VAGLDVRSLGSPTAPRSAISGRFTGSVLGFEPTTARAELELRLDSSQVGRQPIRAGQARIALARGTVDLDGQLTLPEGGLEIDGQAFPFEQPIRYSVREARFRGLDVAAWIGRADWATRLTGVTSLQGSGTDPATLVASGRLDLDPSTVNAGPVQGELTWRAENGRVNASTKLRAGGGTVDATGVVLIAEPVSYELSAKLDLPALGPMLGRDSLTAALAADLELAGRGTTRESLDGTLTLAIRDGSFQAVEADSGKVALRITDGFLQADTLWLRTNLGTVDGGGGVPLRDYVPRTADLAVQVRVDDLDPLETALAGPPLSLGSGTATITISGPTDSLTLTGDARVDALAVGTTRLVGMVANLNAALSWTDGIHRATGHAELAQLSFPTGGITQTTVDARYTPRDDLVIEAESKVDARRTARFAARLDPSAAEPWWTIENARLESDGVQWTMPRPARFRLQPTLAVDSLVLEAPEGRRIAVDGALDLAGNSDFHVAVDSFPIETIADLVGFERLGGTITTRLDLTGRGDALRGTGNLDFVVRGREGEVGQISLEGTLTGDLLQLDGGIDQQGARTAVLAGSIPWPLRTGGAAATGPMNLTLRADSFAIGFAQPFLDARLAQIQGGQLSGEVRLSGSPARPNLAGQFRLARGRVLLPEYGVTYGDAEGTVAFDANQIRVERLSLRSGDGTLVAQGQIRLEDLTLGELDLALRANSFRAVHSDAFRAVASADLNVRGTTMAPVINGSISVERGDLFLDAGIAAGQAEPVELTERDYAMLEDYFGFPIRREGRQFLPTFEAMALDLTLRAGRDSWLRQRANPELAVQMVGEIRVRKEPGPDIHLVGELETIAGRSYVEQFGRRFRVRSGRLAFQGAPLETTFDLEAEYTVPSRTHDDPEAVIVLGIDGKVGDLEIVLSSEPSMENADIVSYIATGRPAARALDMGGGNGITAAGTSLALGQATGALEAAAGQQLGLDVVEIRRDALGGTTLIAGRYVSPTLYLGFKQPISLREAGGGTDEDRDAQTEVEIELQAYRWLLLNLQSGGDALQFFLRARRGY
jgi:translocation and assembly module TamB